jgi:AAA domain (dynein-related subfamily)
VEVNPTRTVRERAPAKSLRVCLYGPTGSGKSTIAEHLAARYDAELVKVAEPLYRFQQRFYQILGVTATGQDGELLQFLAHKIERERPGWLGRTMVGKVLSSTSPIVINDDCRWNSYPALARADFVFVRVWTSPAEIRRRLRRDRTAVRGDHPVERGFDRFSKDYEIDNNGPLDGTLAAADQLMEELIQVRWADGDGPETPTPDSAGLR